MAQSATEQNREHSRRWRERHPETARAKSAAWKNQNPEAVLAQNKRWRDATAKIVYAYYGEQCACCGTHDDLSIDHIDGCGAEHRFELFGDSRWCSHRFRRWLIVNGFPAGYQTLCRPCNRSKGEDGRCQLPHTFLPLEPKMRSMLAAGTTIEEVSVTLGITKPRARSLLEWLRDEDVIKIVRRKKAARWVFTSDAPPC